MNYWEQRKSFWNTGKGMAVMILGILILLGIAVIALNILSSPYPIIESFNASPVVVLPGEASVLRWSVIGAQSVEIDPGIGRVASKGNAEVKPVETTTYILTAVNGSAVRTRTAKVMVGER